MGTTLCFGTGDPDALAELAAGDPERYLDRLEAGVAADFSLHLVPRDLDLLSEAIGRVSDQPSRQLRPSLDVLVDTADGGLLQVADDWVAYAARVPPDRAEAVTDAWFGAMRRDHDEPDLAVTAEAAGAVADLLGLCRAAATDGRPVLHWWWP